MENLLSQGNNLIIATSKPKIYTEAILEQHNIKKYFKFISGATLDGTLSKKEDIIKNAIEKLNITKLKDCIMIGDTKFDIIGAQLNNINSIGVKYGFGTLEELSNATFIVENTAQIEEIINNFKTF